VGGIKGIGDFGSDCKELLHVERAASDAMLQGSAVEVLHGDKGLLAVPADFIDGANVRMIQCGSRASFAAEAFERLRIVGELFGQEFESDRPAEFGVLRFVDHPHPAAANPFKHAVMGNGLPDEGLSLRHDGKCLWRVAWQWLKPTFGAMTPSEVTTQSIIDYRAKRLAAGKSASTANKETTLLKAMLNFGRKLTPPLVASVPSFPARLREAAPRSNFVTPEQYRLLATAAKSLWLRTLVCLGFTYGFRKSEMLSLRCGQCDLIDRWISLREGETKSGESRKVKMTGEVHALLSAACSGKGPNDFVLTRENGQRVVDERKAWYALCAACKLGELAPAESKRGHRAYRGLNLHDLRRAAVRQLIRRGVPQSVAMKISGHKTASMFRRYDIVDERDLENAALLLEGPGHGKPHAQTVTKTDTRHVRPSSLFC